MGFNLIDFAIVILLIIGAINGYRKGFIASLVGFLGSIVALFLSIKFYRPFAGVLNEKFSILAGIHGFLAKHLPLPLEVSTAPVNQRGIEVLAVSINKMMLPEFIKDQVIEQAHNLAQTVGQLGLSTIGDLLTFIIATTLLNGLALLILWFLIDKSILLMAKILSKSLDNTFLGGINRFGGLLVNTALNVIAMMVIIGIFTFFLEVTSQANSSMLVAIAKTVNQSVLVPYFKQGYVVILSKVISFI